MTTTETINEDAFHGDDGKSPDQILREVEEFGRTLAVGDNLTPHENRPEGYGTLSETYEWRLYKGQEGTEPYVRPVCLRDTEWMTLTLKVDPRYGRNEKNGVLYNGLPVQAWECRNCNQWVVK